MRRRGATADDERQLGGTERVPPWWSWWGALLLVAWGVAVCLHFGRFGLVAVDQCGIFDGGWRVLRGQVPYRDFVTLTGSLPMVVQAGFFRVFGVTWFAYVLHAAVANGVFCVGVAWLLARLGLGRGMAALAGVLTALCFQTPMGTPYMEQSGFLWFVAGVLLLEAGAGTGSRRWRRLAWGAVPVTAVLTFLSKQNVALLFWPVLGTWAMAVAMREGRWREMAACLGCGGLMALAGLGMAGWALGVDPVWFREFTFGIAARLGGERAGRGLASFASLALMSMLPAGSGFVLAVWAGSACRRLGGWRGRVALLGVLGVAAMVAMPWWQEMRRLAGAMNLPVTAPRLLLAWFPAALAMAGGLGLGFAGAGLNTSPAVGWLAMSGLASWGFALLTNNQPSNAFPLTLASGVVVLAACAGMAGSPWWRRGAVCMAAGVVAFDVALFAYTDWHRTVNDQRLVPGEVRALRFGALRFLRYHVPEFRVKMEPTAEQLEQLIGELEAGGKPFLVFSDLTVLYGALGQVPASPEVWYHSAMLSPYYRETVRAGIEARWIREMERTGVTRVVLQSEETWVGVRLRDFPAVAEWIRRRVVGVRRFGPVELLELAPGPGGHLTVP